MQRAIRLSAWACATCGLAFHAAAQPVAPPAPDTERVSLGVSLSLPGVGTPPCDALAAGTAACVLSVMPNSAAQRAGFRAGDLIRRFGSTDVTTADDMVNAVAAAKVGDRVAVVVERDGQREELQIEFSAADVRRPVAAADVRRPVAAAPTTHPAL